MKRALLKYREVIAVVVFLLAISGVCFLVIKPLLAKINDSKDKIQEELLKRQATEERLTELPKIKQQYLEVQSNERLEDALLDKGKAVYLIEGLEKMAADTNNKINITIQDSSVQKNQQQKPKTGQDNSLVSALPNQNYLPIRLSLTGSYNTITDFIDRLEAWTYYMDITVIDIHQEDAINNSNSNNSNLDPFNAQTSKGDHDQTSNRQSSSELVGNLDVVFYTQN